jgi:hypothetical protein
VIITGPVEFGMSTRVGPTQSDIGALLQRKRIGRSFAIATKEVTIEQFLRFRLNHGYGKSLSPRPDGRLML